MRARRTTAVLIALILVATASAGAQADPTDPMAARVEAVLAEFPGGVQTAWNEVQWDDGDVTLTIDQQEVGSEGDGPVAFAAIGSCASGTYCVYSRANQAGTKLAFTSCGPHSVSPLGAPVRAVANGRTSGSVQAKNGSTLVLTVPVTTSTNTTATITQVGC